MMVGYQNMSDKKYYDSRIEWLESTGTQYVDTGINYHSNNIIDIILQDFKYTGNYCHIFGSREGSKICGLRNMTSDTSMAMVSYAGTLFQFNLTDQRIKYAVHIENGNSYTDFGYKNTDKFQLCSSNIPMFLFGLNEDGKAVYNSSVRIRRFSVRGTLDLFPVRFTNENGMTEGAMFDEVSKKLFRNIGKGKFICGPDLRG